ncbi:MAG: extracellular solute-binding protein [Ruminococcaceae bacterium]|nr:extracellular solute-binding protein [Oscillospiraceae bacterium]
MKSQKLTSILLLAALLAGCGAADAPQNSDTSDTTAATTPAETEIPYTYPEINWGGEVFAILNTTNSYGQYTTIDLPEATGDILDDAVYNRNRRMEERFNFVMEVTDKDVNSAESTARSTIMAGDDVYEFVYLQATRCPNLMKSDALVDLSDVPELSLESPWWDQSTAAGARIGEAESIFFAENYFSLMGFDCTLCMYVNESMLETLGQSAPYDLVREGKWTFDEMLRFTKLGANLNGANDFVHKADSPATYGLTTWATGVMGLMIGMEAYFAEINDEGMPEILMNNEHFLNTADILAAKLTSVAGEFLIPDGSVGNHEATFMNSDALLMVGQICTTKKYREMNDNYGILPLPKLDENQKEYHNLISNTQLLMTLPVTNANREEAAAIMDAMAYASFTDVLPVYYDFTVSRKGLRNEDSIEMLDIIRETRYFNPGEAYGWTKTLRGNVVNQLIEGNGAIASTVATALPAAEKLIEATMEIVNS